MDAAQEVILTFHPVLQNNRGSLSPLQVQIHQVNLSEQALRRLQAPPALPAELFLCLLCLHFSCQCFCKEESRGKIGAEGEFDDWALQFLHLEACHHHHLPDVALHCVFRKREELSKRIFLGRERGTQWGSCGTRVKLHPLFKQALIAFLALLIVALIDQILVYFTAPVSVEGEQRRLLTMGKSGNDALGVEVGVVDKLGEIVFSEDAQECADRFIQIAILSLQAQLSQLSDETQGFGRRGSISKEEMIGQEVEEQVSASLVVAEGECEVDEVLDGAFLVLVRALIKHMPHQLVEKYHYLQFVEVDKSSACRVDQIHQQQHTLLGSNAYQFIHSRRHSQDRDCSEQWEGGKSFIAKEPNEKIIALSCGFHHDCLQQLHVVLDGFFSFLKYVELFEQPLVHYGLRKDINQVVGATSVRDQQMKKLQNGQRRQRITGCSEQTIQNVVLAQVHEELFRSSLVLYIVVDVVSQLFLQF